MHPLTIQYWFIGARPLAKQTRTASLLERPRWYNHGPLAPIPEPPSTVRWPWLISPMSWATQTNQGGVYCVVKCCHTWDRTKCIMWLMCGGCLLGTWHMGVMGLKSVVATGDSQGLARFRHQLEPFELCPDGILPCLPAHLCSQTTNGKEKKNPTCSVGLPVTPSSVCTSPSQARSSLPCFSGCMC